MDNESKPGRWPAVLQGVNLRMFVSIPCGFAFYSFSVFCNNPGIVNRTFENRTQSNPIRGLSSIEFGNRTKSNTKLSVSSISEQIELNRTQSI